MNLPQISIKNPVFAWMLMFGLMIFGLISFKGMGVGQMPDVDFPVLSIDVTWEGASPEVIERDVVDIIEDAVMGVQGLKDISSSSKQDSADITLEFDLDRDIDVALQEVQSKISEVQRRLPEDIDPPVIQKRNPEDQPIMWLGVSSTHPLKDLMVYVDRSLKDRFKTINGVGEVFLSGFIERNLRIWVDQKKLDAYQLTVSDLIEAIQAEHVELPAGYIETSEREIGIRTMGEANTVADFEGIMINKRGGQPIYKPIPLKEVARVEDGLADIRRISRVSGQTAVGLGIRKQRGANSVDVAVEVKKRVVEIQKELPEGYQIGINFDSTRFIEDAVHELVFTLLLSAILTSLVCWMFFGSFSTNLNILLAIPTSILGSFILIRFCGFTLNTFTLLGLSLAIGIVVDDAIMVLENIVRYFQTGLSRREAALQGATQILSAAFAASLAIIAIFIPVVYMEGIIGKFFLQFGVTISIAVALSLLEALTLAPMRCAQFLEITERKTRFGQAFEGGFNRLTSLYAKTLVWALNHKRMVFVLSICFFAGSLMVMPFLRKEFVPAQDQSMMLVRLKTPISSSIHYTNEKIKLAEEIVSKNANVKRYFSAVGGFGGGDVNSGMLFITLHQPSERPKDPEARRRLGQQELMDKFRAEFNQIPDLQAIIQDLSMRGFTAQRGFPIEFSVRGPEWNELVKASGAMMEKMKADPLFQDVDTDYLYGKPEIRVYPDRKKAFEHGVSIRSVAQAIEALMGGQKVSKYTVGGRRYDIRVQLEQEQRLEAADISKLKVWNNRGELVTLSSLVTVEEKPTLLSITRRGRERAIGVFANVGTKQSQAAAIERAQAIAKEVLPAGYRAVFSGSSETFKKSFQSLMFAMWLGILVAYMVLASQFNRWLQPLVVLLALPFSISGALVSLWITGQSINIFSLIGILLLMGIVKKNSILIVEFANQLREEGMPVKEALLKACPIRFRPIMMTSIATIAAALPPALAMGPGAETRIPMAITIIGGVIVSTLLSLIVVPAAYLVTSRWEHHHSEKS